MQQPPSKLYVLLIIVFGISIGYVFYNQWVKPSEDVIPQLSIGGKDSLMSLKGLKIDFGALNNKTIGGLVASGESPVLPGVASKKDIFAP